MPTTEKKITKRDRFMEIRTILEDCERNDLIEFIDHEVELLNNKRASKRPTPNQERNKELTELLMSALSETPVTIATLCETIPEFNGFTPQKVSGLLRPLIDADIVVKTMLGKKAHFSLAVGE